MNEYLYQSALRNYRREVLTDSGRRMLRQELADGHLTPEFRKAAEEALRDYSTRCAPR